MGNKYQYKYDEHCSLGHGLQILASGNLGDGVHLDICCGWGRLPCKAEILQTLTDSATTP